MNTPYIFVEMIGAPIYMFWCDEIPLDLECIRCISW